MLTSLIELEPIEVSARITLLLLTVVGVEISATKAAAFAQTEYPWSNETCCVASCTQGTSYAVGNQD